MLVTGSAGEGRILTPMTEATTHNGRDFNGDETLAITKYPSMNQRLILFFGAFLNATFYVLSCYAATDPTQSSLDPPMVQDSAPTKKDSLSAKVLRMPLNQNVPTEVKVGLSGITTLQFPAKIEAINGYGFALQPNPDTDVFSLIYDKGTNFLSLKALKPGVSANLTVVINEKVYCFFCEQDNNPSFVMIFSAPGEQWTAPNAEQAQSAPPQKKEASREQLFGFLGELKDYVRLKAVSADSISVLNVAEPNKQSTSGALKTVLKRVVRDDALGLVGFEVELSNRSQSDFYLDPEGFAVRVGDVRFEQSVSDCGGIVPAGTSVPAYFVVSEAPDGRQNDLAVDQNFEVQVRASDPANNSTAAENFVEPPQDRLPVATPGKESVATAHKVSKETPKEGKETPKKANEAATQVSAKVPGKTAELAAKKHWYDLFRRNSVTSE
jgi:hypothetical protein